MHHHSPLLNKHQQSGIVKTKAGHQFGLQNLEGALGKEDPNAN